MTKFQVFNPGIHPFSYHPETTYQYYLEERTVEAILTKMESLCEGEKEWDTMQYLRAIETVHREFCAGKIRAAQRRATINVCEQAFVSKWGDRPQHANSAYDYFYTSVNEEV